MRPNLAQDAPPTALTIGGVSYPIDSDYRTWIGVIKLMEELDFSTKDEARFERSVRHFMEIEEAVFGRVLEDADVNEVLNELIKFSKGYPCAPMKDSVGRYRTYSFEYDLNSIIIAIRNQSGIDLSYKCRHFHWWLFLLEFRTLCGEHYILHLMQARGYEGQDRDLIRRREACALPEEYTEEEKAEYEALDALFQ